MTSRPTRERIALARAALAGPPLVPRARERIAHISCRGRVVSVEEYAAFAHKMGRERAHPARAWLRAARQAKAWTRPALAKALGLPGYLLALLEHNPDALTSPERAEALGAALDLDPGDVRALVDERYLAPPAPRPPRPPRVRTRRPPCPANDAVAPRPAEAPAEAAEAPSRAA